MSNEMKSMYDVIVLGGGPAGYTAALYAARAGLSAVVLEKMVPGGQVAVTSMVDNYPGFDEGVDGFTLGEKMKRGAERFGAVSIMTEAKNVRLSGSVKEVDTPEGVIRGKTVVIATGASHRKLGLAQEEKLTGRGVSYCATCDGMFYRNKTVAIVGGGNTAVEDALHLSRLCKQVILIHRRDTLRASKVYHDALLNASNVSFHWDSVVEDIIGEDQVTGVRVKQLKTGEVTDVPVEGVFIAVGRIPETAFLQGQLTLDPSGYILADETTRTSIPGVYAVGDVRIKAVRQIVTAVADGAVAIHYAEDYLREQEH